MREKDNKNVLPNARRLRRNMTKEERHLWYDFLRTYPIHIYKQKIFGKYIVEFYCARAKLVIELDGSQHFEKENEEKDKQRTAFLENYGLRVIRIPNNEVNNNFRAVCEYIDREIKLSICNGETD